MSGLNIKPPSAKPPSGRIIDSDREALDLARTIAKAQWGQSLPDGWPHRPIIALAALVVELNERVEALERERGV